MYYVFRYGLLYREEISEAASHASAGQGLVTLAQRTEVGPIHVWAAENDD